MARKGDGEYVVILAVGGKNNPQIVPTEMFIFSEQKWNDMIAAGKTIKKIVYATDRKRPFTQQEINEIKKIELL